MLFELLIKQLFSWLPTSLWLGVWAVIAVALFVVTVKLLALILDFIFRFIDIFT